jgi:hypothetical protein
MSYSPHANPHPWNQTRMVWLPTGRLQAGLPSNLPTRHAPRTRPAGLGVGSKGILPLCPIVLFPTRLSTTLEPDQDGLATNWFPQTGLPANMPMRHAPQTRPAGLEVGSKGILPLCPISPIPHTLIHIPGTRPGWSGYQLVYTNGIASQSVHAPNQTGRSGSW